MFFSRANFEPTVDTAVPVSEDAALAVGDRLEERLGIEPAGLDRGGELDATTRAEQPRRTAAIARVGFFPGPEQADGVGEDLLRVLALLRDFREPGTQTGEDRRDVHARALQGGDERGALVEPEPELDQRRRAGLKRADERTDALTALLRRLEEHVEEPNSDSSSRCHTG